MEQQLKELPEMSEVEFDEWWPKPKPHKLRRAGNTTQLADWYIQRLFMAGTTGDIIDHYTETHSGHECLQKIVLRRLEQEHGGATNYRIRQAQVHRKQYMQIGLP